jgi:starvation-inducible outer membrane lipoprotein
MRKHRICAAALCLALCLLLSACGGRAVPPEIPDEEEEEQSAPVLSAAARECLGEGVSSGNTEDVLVLDEDFT